MKKIWKYLKDHVKADYNLKHYLTVASILAIAIILNYTFDARDNYVDPLGHLHRVMVHFLFYSLIYYSVIFSFVKCYNQHLLLNSRMFWATSAFGIFVLSVDTSVPFLYPLIERLLHPELRLWAYKVATNMVSFLTVFLPVIVFYFVYGKKDDHIYGLKPKQFDARPYLLMLGVMLPFLLLASFHPTFLNQYPMYRNTSAHTYLAVGEWQTVLVYEIAYGLDFITVEFLFRGFFVIGMVKFLGRGSVLSMAALYCTLHFGKPAGEAISSIFGGYLLGVIALETRSIWGGIIVHAGVAWAMEVVAFLHK
jgi:hypothetical protein